MGKTGKPTETRNQARRPRDLLGRPPPWGAETALELEDFDALTIEENHRLGREHLNAGRFFPAHEAWETAWKQGRDTTDAEFFKGLSQLGAGYVHLLRGNAHGAKRLLRRASGRIRAYPSGHRGVDTIRVADTADALAADIESGEILPGEDAVFVPARVCVRASTLDVPRAQTPPCVHESRSPRNHARVEGPDRPVHGLLGAGRVPSHAHQPDDRRGA